MLEWFFGMVAWGLVIAEPAIPIHPVARPLETISSTDSSHSIDAVLASRQLVDLVLAVDLEKREGRGRRASVTLAEGLSDRDPTIRWMAACMLTRLGQDAVGSVTPLTRAIHDSDQMVRWAAADALREILPHCQDGMDILMEELSDEDELVRWSAIQTVAKVGPRARRAAPILVELLGDDSVVVRREAARTLRAVFPHFTSVSVQVR
ncbi:HEAT repeat domain-containing protein [bacterium]|nr:HEAT repeat domain-containing protein [bacterium]